MKKLCYLLSMFVLISTSSILTANDYVERSFEDSSVNSAITGKLEVHYFTSGSPIVNLSADVTLTLVATVDGFRFFNFSASEPSDSTPGAIGNMVIDLKSQKAQISFVANNRQIDTEQLTADHSGKCFRGFTQLDGLSGIGGITIHTDKNLYKKSL